MRPCARHVFERASQDKLGSPTTTRQLVDNGLADQFNNFGPRGGVRPLFRPSTSTLPSRRLRLYCM